MAKIYGVLFNGNGQILCNGELSTVIDEQLKVEPAEEENKAEEPKEDENKAEEPKEDENKPKEKK